MLPNLSTLRGNYLRSGFTKSITIPDQIGGLYFVDVQGPFEVESLEGSVYKVGIVEGAEWSQGLQDSDG